MTQQTDNGSGSISPSIYAPDEQGNLVEVTAEEQNNAPIDPIAAAAIRAVQEGMRSAGVEDVDSWLATLDNAIFTPGIEEGHAIFLINRALRLLTIECRDANEAERNAALMGIVDVKALQFWLPALEKVTFPFFAKYKVGLPGLRFTEGKEPQWFKTTQAINTAQAQAQAEQAQEAKADDTAPCSTEPA